MKRQREQKTHLYLRSSWTLSIFHLRPATLKKFKKWKLAFFSGINVVWASLARLQFRGSLSGAMWNQLSEANEGRVREGESDLRKIRANCHDLVGVQHWLGSIWRECCLKSIRLPHRVCFLLFFFWCLNHFCINMVKCPEWTLNFWKSSFIFLKFLSFFVWLFCLPICPWTLFISGAQGARRGCWMLWE